MWLGVVEVQVRILGEGASTIRFNVKLDYERCFSSAYVITGSLCSPKMIISIELRIIILYIHV